MIGDETDVQGGAIVHVDPDVPTTFGVRLTIGHRAIAHGATMDHDRRVGKEAIVLHRVRVGHRSLIGAGVVCTEGTEVQPNSLVLGIPARAVCETTPRCPNASPVPHRATADCGRRIAKGGSRRSTPYATPRHH